MLSTGRGICDKNTTIKIEKYAVISITNSMAVQAVLCELVSEGEFPVRREETGNFSKKRGF